MRSSLSEYQSRINRVINYIKENPGKPMSLEGLAELANFSKFHFHRVFRAHIGETLNDFIRRQRLERSVHYLIHDRNADITNIALRCGFSSSANYAKAFKQYFSQTPSQIRTQLDFRDPKVLMSKIGKLKRNTGKDLIDDSSHNSIQHDELRRLDDGSFILDQLRRTTMDVQVKELPDQHVAYIRNIGPYNSTQIGPVFGKLFAWAGPNGHLAENTRTLGVSWSDPNITPTDKCQFDACVTVDRGIKTSGEISTQILKGGKYAVYHCEVKNNDFHAAWMELMRNWLPSSGFQADDRPCVEEYLNEADKHPEKMWIVDICLPIKAL